MVALSPLSAVMVEIGNCSGICFSTNKKHGTWEKFEFDSKFAFLSKFEFAIQILKIPNFWKPYSASTALVVTHVILVWNNYISNTCLFVNCSLITARSGGHIGARRHKESRSPTTSINQGFGVVALVPDNFTVIRVLDIDVVIT